MNETIINQDDNKPIINQDDNVEKIMNQDDNAEQIINQDDNAEKMSVSPGSLVRCRRQRRLLASNVLPHTSTLLTKASQASQAPLPSC